MFSLAPTLLCELRAKAGAAASLRALCVCVLVLLWQQTVLLFPSGQVARQWGGLYQPGNVSSNSVLFTTFIDCIHLSSLICFYLSLLNKTPYYFMKICVLSLVSF